MDLNFLQIERCACCIGCGRWWWWRRGEPRTPVLLTWGVGERAAAAALSRAPPEPLLRHPTARGAAKALAARGEDFGISRAGGGAETARRRRPLRPPGGGGGHGLGRLRPHQPPTDRRRRPPKSADGPAEFSRKISFFALCGRKIERATGANRFSRSLFISLSLSGMWEDFFILSRAEHYSPSERVAPERAAI